MNYKDYYKYLQEDTANDQAYIKVLITRGLKRYPDADKQEVFSYCTTNASGVSIKKFEDDAKTHKWDDDTIKAIGYIMSRNRKKSK